MIGLYRHLIFILVVVSLSTTLHAQPCNLQLTGRIVDEHDENGLELATVLVEESGDFAYSDMAGNFTITGLCAGSYHIIVQHVGCETVRTFVELSSDTTLRIALEHHSELLQELVVKDEYSLDLNMRQANSISSEQLRREAGKPLSEIVEAIPGVSALKNGSGISKPVIHGLFGNRVLILNNGLVQAGQQWGNDHAPEIDPSAASNISVIKGVQSVEYAGNALGGVVVIDQGGIEEEPHVHGQATYRFATNSRGNQLSYRMQSATDKFGWRFTASGRYAGDRRAPNYFLNNTGDRAASGTAMFQFKPFDWSSRLFYSYYQTELGILRGGHIGNTTDLDRAIGADEPFFTEPNFSYKIEAPRQQVSHHLLKFETRKFIADRTLLAFKYGLQHNQREEFDIRRGDRSDIPALALTLWSQQFRTTLTLLGEDSYFKAGLVLGLIDNTNNPGTGVLPLIPNYDRYEQALWAMWMKTKGDWSGEIGARIGLSQLEVVAISRTIPREILRFNHDFLNYSVGAGLTYAPASSDFVSKLDLGVIQRAPEANELYSFGLHQGAAGIEEGDADLGSEQSFKAVWTNDLELKRWFFELSIYQQVITNYIFLEPQAETRLTIRGAFPVFIYQQTDAMLSGLDLLAKWEPADRLELLVKASVLRGQDLSNNIPLVYMPSNNFFGSLSYFLPDAGKLSGNTLSINARHVMRQDRLLPEQDFLAAPDAYSLLGLSLESKILVGGNQFLFNFQVDNLLNEQYRDYLNRLRYFADEEGRNFRLTVSTKF